MSQRDLRRPWSKDVGTMSSIIGPAKVVEEAAGWLLNVEVVLEMGMLVSNGAGGKVEADCVLYRVVEEGMSVEEEEALVMALLM